MDESGLAERGERAFAYGSSRFGLTANADRCEALFERLARRSASGR
jgi:hypothetical protein